MRLRRKCCPVCSYTDRANRNGKAFKCLCCGHTDDADHVGSVNIQARADDAEIRTAKKHKDIKTTLLKRNSVWKAGHLPQAEAAA